MKLTVSNTHCTARSLVLSGLILAFGPALAETEPFAGQTPESTIACASHRAEQRRAPSPTDQLTTLREEIRAYQRLAEETLSKRAGAIDLYHELRGKLLIRPDEV